MSIPIERIEQKIFVIREVKVMLDRDIAELYGVTTKALNQAVRRNKERFPEDFMFLLTFQESQNLKSQIVTSSLDHGGSRKLPSAFTEQGVAMLSSVLRSKRAILTNIQIIRAFSKLRALLSQNEELNRKLEYLEHRYDKQFKIVFDTLRKLIADDDSPKPQIGFHT